MSATHALGRPEALAEADHDETQLLIGALQRVQSTSAPKANVRSTDHIVTLLETQSSHDPGRGAATIQEEVDDDKEEERPKSAQQSKGSQPDSQAIPPGSIVLTSWKTQEFAYRKTTRIGYREGDELPTLARGLFTSLLSDDKGHRIVVRGYDKFFNEGEMPWTKPSAIDVFSTPPYELSFKENGCIIFIAALTEKRLIVTSKHSLGSSETNRMTHAQMGEQWLDKHLATVKRSKVELAGELWKRNETAVAELCDDSFEEHVLAYPPERTGLHLHGLNSNTSQFRTRSMREVESFAKVWGFLPTRFIEVDSLVEVDRFCQQVAKTGSWQGIPIEGFVVRTHMPEQALEKVTSTVAPPYQPGQAWFFKVKFDEPYLMYRDWRELARKMLTEKKKWDNARKDAERPNVEQHTVKDATVASQKTSSSDEGKSKSQLKKEARKAKIANERYAAAERAALAAAGIAPPDPPQTRSKRPETVLFVQWCHEKLYGSKDGKTRPQTALFDGFEQSKGIIRLREAFIRYMQSEEGQRRLSKAGNGTAHKQQQAHPEEKASVEEPQNFTRTLIVPIAVPGCGKTALAVALQHLIPNLGHTQSDDITTKKTAATFVKNIQKELDDHEIVFADRNNHLFKHRDEIADCVAKWQEAGRSGAQPTKGRSASTASEAMGKVERRVRLVAFAWALDTLPRNAIHHICSERIDIRGENHQSLRSTAEKAHEKILWRFLSGLEPFGSAARGGGDQGHGDEKFHNVVRMDVNASLEQNIMKALRELVPMLSLTMPNATQIDAAMNAAKLYKVGVKKDGKTFPTPAVRYYAIAAAFDVKQVIGSMLENDAIASAAFRRLIDAQRLNEWPHVTLVHSKELSSAPEDGAPSEQEQQRQVAAQERWNTYAAQSKLSPPVEFVLSIDMVAWDERAMSLGVCRLSGAASANVEQLQSAQWRPHITLGTFAEDIRPYEGYRVVKDADESSHKVHCYRFAHPLQVTGYIKGLS